jgi:hypothetical protein
MENETVLFREVQRFGRILRWCVIFDLSIFIVVMFLLSESLDDDIWIVPVLVIGIVLVLLLCTMKMETEVRADGLYIRFFPFHLGSRKYTFSEISEYYSRQYSPLREYGGWGIRWSFRHGRAYNVRGRQGVQLVLTDGKRVLVGTQRPEELVEAMDRAARK